ncbi:Transmembrane protein 184A [Ananas comosus]|uniref:Transmembrane protein 184A n=1 Tax=Ananas comosus TaxID=4615 RepID=A0A199UIH1_ANACO|nr:Transmembrane protein 184A [Ananas comosus]
MASVLFVAVALPCAAGATVLAMLHIYRHLQNYTEPTYQRLIVRIIFMVPVYAVMSFLSLVLRDHSIYFNSIREVYDAWVIYNFLSLCLAWVGGPGAVVLSLSGRVLKPSWVLMTCCFPAIPLDGCGVLVFLAAKSGFVKNAGEAADFQNFVLCIEMLAAAVGHLFAFPYKEYAGANIGGSRDLRRSLAHALNLNDFYHDTVHQFAPTYHDYVLYNNGEGDDGARKYRSRTFVPTGQEMDAVRRNKHVCTGRADNAELSNIPLSSTSPNQSDREAIKSSLLKENAAASARPYDLSILSDIDLSKYPAEVPAVADSSKQLPLNARGTLL